MLGQWGQLAPFIRLLRHHLKWMVLGTGLGLLAVASAVGLLALSGWFISAAAFAGLSVATAQLFNFFHPSIGIRLFAIGRTLARYAERLVTHDTTLRILQSLRCWFYIQLEPLAPSRLMMFRSGDILNRIVADIDALDNLYLRVLSPSVMALIITFLVTGFLWLFDPLIALSTALFLLIAGFGVPSIALQLGAAGGYKLTLSMSDLRIRIVDGLQGLPELLVFGAYPQYRERIAQSSLALVKNQLHMSHIRGVSTGLITLLAGLAVLPVLYLAVNLVNREALDGAGMALVTLAVMASFEAVLPLPTAYQYLGRTRQAGRRLLEIVNTRPQVLFPEQSITSFESSPEVTFEKVSFRYHEKAPWALNAVDFRIPSGWRVAIIGETGSGKSTLVQLLVRFWDPGSGRIRLGDEDVRNFSETDLRGLISVVSQQPHMFNATIRENLLMASPGAADDDLWAALDAVQLSDFVHDLPDSLETWVGEAGQLLSGGQARRVAVARAILHNAPLWVLDEPTEGLDAITERKMMQALKSHTAQRTLLLITHRLVDLNWMDQIVMLDRGRIIARGSHEELLQNNERYAALHRRIT
ncbi:MAG: cysteine/glutathione ABC transporter ATP-binding protein/permease CydC [Desulfobacterales bacterium]|nr:MAG: cysteine/glutathione ABC transporter ATP-binding protein/permease CydC [Desulfobacterales bacterium]